jgi:hypothetical protein
LLPISLPISAQSNLSDEICERLWFFEMGHVPALFERDRSRVRQRARAQLGPARAAHPLRLHDGGPEFDPTVDAAHLNRCAASSDQS